MKICIVGGGTAGWIAAYYIVSSLPEKHDITVVESSKIGIIGAGEGSTGILRDLLDGVFFSKNVDVQDFMTKTDSTAKMGIKHTNWTSRKNSYLAPLDTTDTGFTFNDYILKYVISEFGNENIHLASRQGVAYHEERYFAHAFHFDAHKVGKYFRGLCPDVKVIDAIVNDVALDVSGKVSHVVLDTSQKIDADVFIDCSGFSRVIMKKMNSGWISTQDVLPVNTAMPFIVKYKENEIVKPHTGATALSSGWMWDIPLTTRRGCGYVFDHNFISEEQAVEEVQSHLGTAIEPLKFIKFESGYSDKFIDRNVVCLGLSSSFFEPLEATSIHNTIVQVSLFVEMCLRRGTDFINDGRTQDMYNKRVTRLMEHTTNFISMHYQGGRADTPFWKRIVDDRVITEEAKFFVDMAKVKIPVNAHLDGMWGSYSAHLMNWIFAGMGIITRELARKELDEIGAYDLAREGYNLFLQNSRPRSFKRYIEQV